MTGQPEWTDGQHVCITGRGMDNVVHEHHTVTKVTKTFVTSTQNVTPRRIRRFRISNGASVPYSAYGGTSIHATCQRPKAAK